MDIRAFTAIQHITNAKDRIDALALKAEQVWICEELEKASVSLMSALRRLQD